MVGGDVAASAAAARAAADAAARATASAAAKFESRAGAAASRCVSAALDVFFGVFGAEIKAKLCGKKIRDRYAFDFADAAAAAADPSFFPGQHASDACASALARLRRAAEALDSLASSRGAGRGAEETRAALMRELSSRALVAIKGHFFELGRFAYSAAGALQLKRDLGEFEAWAVSVSSNISNAHGRDARESEKLQDANDGSAVAAAFRDEIQKQWRDTLEACDVLLVSPDALPGLLKQRTAESASVGRRETPPKASLAAKNRLASRGFPPPWWMAWDLPSPRRTTWARRGTRAPGACPARSSPPSDGRIRRRRRGNRATSGRFVSFTFSF